MAKVGRYEVIRALKSGGMGTVRLARAPDGDLVVLKTPHDMDEDSYERLRDEARLGARLLHSAIVDTLDIFDDDGVPVLVVAFVDGISLEQLRGYGPMPTALVARVGRQIAEALDTLHNATDEAEKQLNILHRDVSPGNIVVAKSGDAKLIDLGIARFDERQADKTQDGFLRGTMRYLAPELIKGDSYSWKSDLWALGMVLWEAALGHFAYPADTDRDIVVSIIDGKPMSHGGEHVAPELRDAIAPMLNPDPAARVAAAAEVAEKLRIVEEVFENAQATTAEAVRLILEKQEEADRLESGRPIIGGAPNNEATESFAVPAAKGPLDEDTVGLDDFDEATIAAPEPGRTDDDVIDIPRPVSFVGKHPLPELMDDYEPAVDIEEPTRIADAPSVADAPPDDLEEETGDPGAPEEREALDEYQGLSEPTRVAAPIPEVSEPHAVPRDVSQLAGAPLADWDKQDTFTDYGVAGETMDVSDANIMGEVSASSEAPVTEPPGVDPEEETQVRGPPISGPKPVSPPPAAASDEYVEVDVDMDDIDMLDEVRAQVEPTRVLEAFVPDPAAQAPVPEISPFDASDPSARAPRAEGLGFEYDDEEENDDFDVDLGGDDEEPDVEPEPEHSLEPTGVYTYDLPTPPPDDEAKGEEAKGEEDDQADDDEKEEEPTRDLTPTVEPVIPVEKKFEVTAGPGKGPRLSGRRRPSTQYVSVSPRRAKPETTGDGVAVARIGLKRVAVARDGSRVEAPRAPAASAISVQAVPRIPDSDVAAETQVHHDVVGSPGFEQPEELSAEPFVRTSTQTGARSNPFLVEPVANPEPEGTHAEATHLAAAIVDPYDDEDDDDDDEDNERMNLDDVLDILDD
jgi:serine/threonine protein kinase